MSSLSDKLRLAYEKKGMSYQELAKISKVPRATIQRYVMGLTDRIDIDKLQAICESLDLDIAQLLGWEIDDAELSDNKLNTEIIQLLSGLSEKSQRQVRDYIRFLATQEEDE